jgi:hypothetical protein
MNSSSRVNISSDDRNAALPNSLKLVAYHVQRHSKIGRGLFYLGNSSFGVIVKVFWE